ncbi:MAG: hypothetical protein KGH65_05635 [Candidatus Micrarchaeota archaeon]|nr:hypothetical protein [Candidatus Micrarchaeota archaeon]
MDPKNTGRFGKGNPGKPKGATNKMTRSAKEAFQIAFDELGGAAGLVKWAKTNPEDFYKLYARLIPVDTQISGADGGPVNLALRFVNA